MNIRIIYAIVAGTVIVTGSAVTAYLNRKKLKKILKGKNLVILGQIETGKTSLHSFLREGEIPESHIATRRTKDVPGNTFKLEELKLKISKGKDTSGLKDFEKEWKELFLDGDLCFYLFDSSKVYNNDEIYIKNINNHLKHIGNWKAECESIPHTIVIGTFADQIPIYDELDESSIQKLDEILRSKIQLQSGKISSSDFFIGNLGNENNMKELVGDLLRYLNKQ